MTTQETLLFVVAILGCIITPCLVFSVVALQDIKYMLKSIVQIMEIEFESKCAEKTAL